MRNTLGILLFITKIFVIIFGQELLSEKDYEILKISIDDESQLLKNATENEYKTILRYGFHRTDACQSYVKAFVCIRKCLDFGYQIAESDKKCQCRCYKNKVLAAYTTKNAKNVTSWKYGAPTTTRPSWAKPSSTEVIPKLKLELYADDVSPDGSGSGSGASPDDSHDGSGGESGDGSGDGSNNSHGTETTPLADTNTKPTVPSG